ncbi:MAG: DUF5723 family protein [Candidatus Neomarinimicrobiota bacterium]
MKHKYFAIFTIALILAGNGFAQLYMNPQSIALANAYSAKARGADVIGWNPANLGLDGNPSFSVQFGILPLVPVISMQINNNTISPFWINEKFMTGTYLTDKDKESLMDDIPDEGLDFTPLLHLRILDVSFGRWAVSIGHEVTGTIVLPKSLFRLAFFGNEFEKPIDLGETDAEMQSVTTVAVAHGREIGIPYSIPVLSELVQKVAVGGAAKLLIGTGYVGFEKMNGTVTTYDDRIDLNGNLKARYGVGGVGVAFDLGAAAEINNQITANISLNNLFGFVNWGIAESGIAEYSFAAEIPSEDFDKIDSLLEAGVREDTTYETDRFSTHYPAYLLVGCAYKFAENMDIYANYRQYFRDQLASSVSPTISVACEYRPLDWLPIRAGISVGGLERSQMGFGFGLNFLHYKLDFGISQTGGVFNHAKGMAFSFSQSLVF